MELTHSEIDELYSEPSVRIYRPEAVTAELGDGSYVSALCFNLPVVAGTDDANPDYAARLHNLAQRLGFPREYVENIR